MINSVGSFLRFYVNFNVVTLLKTIFYSSFENYVIDDFIGFGIFFNFPASSLENLDRFTKVNNVSLNDQQFFTCSLHCNLLLNYTITSSTFLKTEANFYLD